MTKNLSKLIGGKFLFRGKTWQLVEVLEAEDSLVIAPANSDSHEPIQPNQYGQANRRCRECITLRLSDAEREGYSETILELLSGYIKQ